MSRSAPMLVICGPTAAGKSALAFALAKRLSGEIVSADSVQLYRGLDIGSAKPSRDELASIAHHLIDVADPTGPFWDAQRWADQADSIISDIVRRGNFPIVCGGTGLYIRALLNGLNAMPPVPDAVKTEVRADMARRGAPAMHAELARVDPASANRLDPNDSQRIGRALEVFRASGRPLSLWQTGIDPAPHPRYPAARVAGLWPSREELQQRIASRVSKMLDSGWVWEVSALVAAGVPTQQGPLTALGYRQVVQHLAGELPAHQLAEAIGRAHRRYAKRQLTWFRGIAAREHDLRHLDAVEIEALAEELASR